jgi:hypothetical protein
LGKSPPQPPVPATVFTEERPRETQKEPACRGDGVLRTTTAEFAHDPDGLLQIIMERLSIYNFWQ